MEIDSRFAPGLPPGWLIKPALVRVWEIELRVQGLGFKVGWMVWALGLSFWGVQWFHPDGFSTHWLGVKGFGPRIQVSGFRILGSGSGVQGSRFGVKGLVFLVQGLVRGV